MTVGNSIARYLLGMLIVVLVKTVTTVIIRELLSQLCRLVVSNVVCRRRVSVVTGKRIHYSPHFITLEQVRHTSEQQSQCGRISERIAKFKSRHCSLCWEFGLQL